MDGNEVEQKMQDIHSIVTEETEGKKRSMFHPLSVNPFNKQKDKKRNGKVKKMTDEEIRQQYGLMKKPFGTIRENIIWLMINTGPISSKQVAKDLNMPIKKIFTPMYDVWMGAGEKYFVREKRGKSFMYSLQDDHIFNRPNVEDICKEISTWKRELKGKRLAEKKESRDSMQPVQEIYAPKHMGIRETVEEALPRNIHVTVEVKGRVEFIFKVEKG